MPCVRALKKMCSFPPLSGTTHWITVSHGGRQRKHLSPPYLIKSSPPDYHIVKLPKVTKWLTLEVT